jgi:hypothetical protein
MNQIRDLKKERKWNIEEEINEIWEKDLVEKRWEENLIWNNETIFSNNTKNKVIWGE